jgi:hypothetical protein
MIVIRRTPAILALAAALATVTGCAAPTAGPSVGSLAECSGPVLDGPGIEAGLCREVAEMAFRSYPGPQLLADNVSVQETACDVIADRSAEAAASGQTCYLVAGNGVAGGRRIRDGVFEGGKVLTVESVVWRSAGGALHASATATDALQ